MGQPPHGYFALGQPVPQQEQSSQESRPIQGQAANQLGQANMAVQVSKEMIFQDYYAHWLT